MRFLSFDVDVLNRGKQRPVKPNFKYFTAWKRSDSYEQSEIWSPALSFHFKRDKLLINEESLIYSLSLCILLLLFSQMEIYASNILSCGADQYPHLINYMTGKQKQRRSSWIGCVLFPACFCCWIFCTWMYSQLHLHSSTINKWFVFAGCF